jgi:hypothetical protein
MKALSLFAQVFTIFAFLTLGSLLLIVAFHILVLDDAITQISAVYDSSWKSFQASIVGFVFIAVGLGYTRALIKKRRQEEALIYQSEIGPIVVSITAIEDVVRKVLKHFHLIKEWKVKTVIRDNDVEIKLRLVLWSGARIQALLTEVQEEVRQRVRKILGGENRLEILCDVHRIEDHELGLPESTQEQVVSL